MYIYIYMSWICVFDNIIIIIVIIIGITTLHYANIN